MKTRLGLVFGFLSTWFVYSQSAMARPEYAAAANIVNCGVCHVNPYGGGARTLTGKLYGNRDYANPWVSRQDLVSLDLRGQDYWVSRNTPQNPQTKGVMLMNAIPTVNAPISVEKDQPAIAQVVLAYNFAPVGASLREAYYLTHIVPANENAWFTNILFGNFNAPFGLMSDEHRTYTKQMTAMTEREFESGMLLTGDPNYRFHYDFALTSGFANGGIGTDSHPDSWAAFLNVRHQIAKLPWQVGFSYAVENTTASSYLITAADLNTVFSFDRYTGRWFKGSLEFEAVYARGWDNSNYTTAAGDGIGYFIPTTAPVWQTAITDSASFGDLFLLNWDLTRHWTLQLKTEQFAPDVGYQGDSFYRLGEGFKYYFTSNANLIVRHDYGYTGRPGLTTTDYSTMKAVGETYFALLHVWL